MTRLDIRLQTVSPSQLASWRNDGVLLVRADEIYPAETVRTLRSWVDEVQSWEETPGKWMMYFENSLMDRSRILNRLENFFPYHNGLNGLFNGGWALGLAGQLLGEPAVCFKEKINFKLPGGGAFAAHQDVQAGWDRYGHTLHVSMAVAIDRATIENGCLEVARGEHRRGLIGPMAAEIPSQICEKLHWETLPMEPGDLICFNSLTPHRSAANRTGSKRRVLYLTYNKASEGDHRRQYYIDKRKSYPPDIEREDGKAYIYKI